MKDFLKSLVRATVYGLLASIFVGSIFISVKTDIDFATLRNEQQILVEQLKKSPKQSSLPVVAQSVINSVVHIVNETQGWQGSGFVVTKDIICTARHVVEGGDDFIITSNNGEKIHATRTILNKNYDIGFIYVDDFTCLAEVCEHDSSFHGVFFGLNHLAKLTPLELGSIKDCKLGESVFAIGSPYGKMNFNSLTSGIISGLDRDWDMTDPYTGDSYGWSIAFTTDSAGHPGNSGCPVFTMDGKVRGILVGGFSPVLICCMPVDLFLNDLPIMELMFLQNKYSFEEYSEEWY